MESVCYEIGWKLPNILENTQARVRTRPDGIAETPVIVGCVMWPVYAVIWRHFERSDAGDARELREAGRVTVFRCPSFLFIKNIIFNLSSYVFLTQHLENIVECLLSTLWNETFVNKCFALLIWMIYFQNFSLGPCFCFFSACFATESCVGVFVVLCD